MSAIAERPLTRSWPAPRPDAPQWSHPQAVATLAELSLAALPDAEIDGVLRLIARRACELLSIKRCGVYLRVEGQDAFTGRVGHPREEIDETVRRLTLGGPSDEISREMVLTQAPIVIRDAFSDPRASRAAIRVSKLRSLLGVPMVVQGAVVGLLIFDNASELHPYGDADIELAKAMAAIAAAAIVKARAEEQLRDQLRTASRQNLLLRRTTKAEHQLCDARLRGGGITAVVELVTELTGRPVALYDSEGRRVAASSRSDGDGACCVRLLETVGHDQRFSGRLRDAVAGSCTSVGPLLDVGLHHRHLAAPVDISGARWGWLVAMEHPSRFTAFDEFLLRRAATHLALELTGRQPPAASSSDAHASFARQLLGGGQEAEDLRRDAECLGIALEVPRVVAYITSRPSADTSAVKLDTLISAVRRGTDGEVLATRGSEGVVLLIDLPADTHPRAGIGQVKSALGAALMSAEPADAPGAPRLVAGISGVCRSPAMLPGAYREAREVTNCVQTFSAISAHAVLAVDDLGPGRLFITNGNAGALERFADDVIGPLLCGGAATDELLRTLEAFFDTGRSVRLSSERLGVHENTVRYRLSRVNAMTGLDVAANPKDQLSVQVALLVLGLQAHPALRAFQADAAGPVARAEELVPSS